MLTVSASQDLKFAWMFMKHIQILLNINTYITPSCEFWTSNSITPLDVLHCLAEAVSSPPTTLRIWEFLSNLDLTPGTNRTDWRWPCRPWRGLIYICRADGLFLQPNIIMFRTRKFRFCPSEYILRNGLYHWLIDMKPSQKLDRYETPQSLASSDKSRDLAPREALYCGRRVGL